MAQRADFSRLADVTNVDLLPWHFDHLDEMAT